MANIAISRSLLHTAMAFFIFMHTTKPAIASTSTLNTSHPSTTLDDSHSTLETPSIGISPSLLSFLCSTLFLTALTFFTCRRNKAEPIFLLPPGPKPWPIIGSLPELLLNKPTFRWIHKMMNDMHIEIMCIRLGNVHIIPVTSPEIALEFLKRQDAVFSDRPTCLSACIMSRGYLTTALSPLGDQWKKMRRVLASDILSPMRHRWLHDKRADEANHLVRYVFNQCDDFLTGGVVNVRVTAQHYCGNVIRRIIFGQRFFGEGREDGGPGMEEEEHMRGLFTILEYLYSFCVSDYFPCLRGRVDLDGHERIMRTAVASVTKYQDPVINRRLREWMEGERTEQKDLLDVLIGLKDKDGSALLSPEEIKAQIVELMIETVDNPSNAVEWAIAEMINQPKILKRATEELDRVVGKQRLVQESDLSQLNYVKACVREAFRLHPIAPFNVPHVSVSDTTVAGYFIPKGSDVLLSRPGLGRNPRVWEEPLRFRPERHIKEDGSDVVLTDPDLRILSFSIGRRGCAGVTLGSTMTVMLMARLLQGFTWRLPPNVSKMELTESVGDLFLARPLLALAKPRLAQKLYLSL